MPSILLYAWSTSPESCDRQLEACRNYCSRTGLAPSGEVRDEGQNALLAAMSLRPTGRAVLDRLAHGDVLVVATPEVLGPQMADALALVKRLRQAGITLHIAHVGNQGPLVAEGEVGEQFLATLQAGVDLDRGGKAAAVKNGMDQLRREGRRVSRHPGIGHRFVRRQGHVYEEPDQSELETIAKVVEWKARGMSWNAIASHLLRSGIRTSSGGEWHPRRLQLAYKLAVEGRLPVLETT